MYPGWLSPYSECIRAGEPRGWSSSSGGGKNFHFSMSSRPALGSTQPPIQLVPVALCPEVKRPGRKTDHTPPTSAEIENVGLYNDSPKRLHSVVLN
jgi:hypothetical protein